MRWMFVVFVVGMHACMLLEVLDFPPLLGLLDAHALWHAATPPSCSRGIECLPRTPRG